MATPPPPITPVPTPAPQRGDRATFSDRVDSFVTWLEGATDEFEAVAENVYENATIAEASGDLASVGLGITTAAPYMPNVDNVGVAAGFWYIDGTTIGTLPLAASPAMLFHKVYGTNGFQLLNYANSDRMFFRRRTGGAWQTWQEVARMTDLTGKAGSGVNTDITQLNGAAQVNLVGAAPLVSFTENDQASPAGRWRMRAEGNSWSLEKNTAAGGDFSSVATSFSANTAGLGFASGNVQQGTGIGQGTNAVKIGWAAAGGLKATVDTTDQGYIPFVSGNPSSGSDIIFNGPRSLQIGNATDAAILGYSGSGAITRLRMGGTGATGGIVQRFDRATGDYTIGYGNTGSETNRINMDSGGAVTLFGGALASLSNSGFLQIGASGGLNVVYDYGQIQARNNGAVSTLSLNFTGGLVQAGPGGFSTSGTITGGTVVSDGVVQAKANSTLKYYMYDGATIRGYVGASSTQCFIVTNAANTIQALYADNSGNITAAGNITANSDESLKKNWRDLPGFLDELAGVTLVGAYERMDTGEIQIGMSAQQVRAFAPELVVAHPDTGLLSLNYGSLGAVAAVKLAQRVKHQQQEINELKILVKHLIEKVGGA